MTRDTAAFERNVNRERLGALSPFFTAARESFTEEFAEELLHLVDGARRAATPAPRGSDEEADR